LARQEHEEIIGELVGLIGYMTPFVPRERRMTRVDSVNLHPKLKDRLQASMRDAPYAYETLVTGFSSFVMGEGRIFVSEPLLPLNEPQEG
jgi:hypothetical protein